jgi:hypothetical protein
MNDQNTELQTSIGPEKGKVDVNVAKELIVSNDAGGIGFRNANEVMEFAKMMAVAGVAVPPHCRGQSGVCLAIIIQSVGWRMSPFAVAQKSYEVNGRMAYESQLVQAIILQRAPIKGRFKVTYAGEDANRTCTVTAELLDGQVVDYTSPPIGRIKVKNSPLWVADPDQQLFYYSARAMCRRHFPDVLLGVYTPEELAEATEPAPQSRLERVVSADTIDAKLNALVAKADDETTDIEPDGKETAPSAPPVAAEAKEPLSSQSAGSTPDASAAPIVEEKAPTEAEVIAPTAIDGKQRTALQRLHKALEGAMTSRGVEKGIAAWRADNAPAEGTRADQVVKLLHRAHLDRVLAKTSPADVDQLFKKALEF